MALALRLRRALSLSSSLLNQQRIRPVAVLSSLTSPPSLNPRKLDHSFSQTSSFRSSPVSLDRRSSDDGGKISPDEILFEGCDFNHWLITVDFPKDPKPTAEEMVETYVQTAAKVFGSVEEAKKRIYACSTTTYQGFQALMDEETSEKFRGLPGVVFILPDSYIDPVNKEYGGDKYENGVITPRPPPVQYRRPRNDRPRNDSMGMQQGNYDRPRNDRPRNDSMGMQQRNPPQDGRGYPQEGGRERPAYQQDFSQGQGGNLPPQGPRNFPQGLGGNLPPQGQGNFPQGQGGNFSPQGPRNFPQEQRNYAPQGQGQGGNFPSQEQRSYPLQGQGGSFPSQEQRNYPIQGQGHGGNFPPQEQRNYTPQGHEGNFPPQEQRDYTPQGQGHGGNFPSHEQRRYPQGYASQGQGQGGNFPPQGQGDYRSGPGYGEPGNTRGGPVEGQWQGKQ